jgi:phosphate transport system substrate-binding protein
MDKRTLALALLASTALAATAHAQSRDQIRIVGSSTVYPFASVVVENFGRNTQYPTPVIESTGSGGGLQIFCQGVGAQHPDIANSSRRIKESELQTCKQNGVEEVTEVKIGYDGIVIANSLDAEPIDVTREQLWKALGKEVEQDGEIVPNPYQRWSEIDPSLPDKEIEVYGPPPTSGTRDAFVELAMEAGCEESEAVQQLDEERKAVVCQTMREDGRFIEAGENDNLIVQRLNQNPDAFGIFGYSFLDQNFDTLQGGLIGGVEPEFDSIASGDYPLSRSLYFYVKNAHVGVIPGIEEYVAEFISDQAMGPDGYLVDRGLITLPEDELQQVRQEAEQLDPLTAEELASAS